MASFIALLPLLHAGQTMLRVTTVDAPILVLAALLFAASATLIWQSPLAGGLRHRSGRRRLGRGAVACAVALAVLPSVLPYDHLLPSPGHEEGEAQEAVHASHCHVSPATCSDAPVTSGPGQLLGTAPLLVVPSMLSVLVLAATLAFTSVARQPDVPPPVGFPLPLGKKLPMQDALSST